VQAYLFCLTDRYPPFSLHSSADFPVDLQATIGRLNRLAVFFRLVLAIPASIAVSLLWWGLGLFSVVGWLITLVRGRQPDTIYEANAAGLRYAARFSGYLFMLTSFYPSEVLGDGDAAPTGEGTASVPPAEPQEEGSPWALRLTKGARRLVVVFFVLGAVGQLGYVVGLWAIARSSPNAQVVQVQNEAVTAYNTLGTQAKALDASATGCDAKSGTSAKLRCLKAVDAGLAGDISSYAHKLADIAYPPGVSTQSHAALKAARQAAEVMARLSQSGNTLSGYISALETSGFEAKLSNLDRTFNALNQALIQMAS